MHDRPLGIGIAAATNQSPNSSSSRSLRSAAFSASQSSPLAKSLRAPIAVVLGLPGGYLSYVSGLVRSRPIELETAGGGISGGGCRLARAPMTWRIAFVI